MSGYVLLSATACGPSYSLSFIQARDAMDQVTRGKLPVNEALLLDGVKFGMTVDLPIKPLRVIVKELGLQKIGARSLRVAVEAFRTTLPIQRKASTIAFAACYIAARMAKLDPMPITFDDSCLSRIHLDKTLVKHLKDAVSQLAQYYAHPDPNAGPHLLPAEVDVMKQVMTEMQPSLAIPTPITPHESQASPNVNASQTSPQDSANSPSAYSQHITPTKTLKRPIDEVNNETGPWSASSSAPG
ncbi:hypothetical protein HK097_008684, partial [Rhizophlyctis rosea]